MARKADPHAKLAAHVAKARKAAPDKELASALGDLLLARLHKRAVQGIQRILDSAPRSSPPPSQQQRGVPRARRSPRRLGRIRFYTPTAKVDVSRLGTFRHYMLSVIRKHGDTRSADAEHAQCDNPKFSKNRLDYNWAADNGYIDWK